MERRLIIDDDFFKRALKGEGLDAPAVAIVRDDRTLQVVFGRAFLLELQRGDLDRARVFARALLVSSDPSVTPD